MKKKIKYFLLILGLVVLVLTALLFFTNFYKIFLGPLEIGRDVDGDYGDVILVLGGGLRKGREIGYSTEERLLLAVELFRQKKRMIIVSDGSLYRRSPAIKKITDFLIKNGVEKTYIHLEGKSQTTFDSFYYTQKMLEKMKSKEVIVCTSPYHQERAQMILHHLKLKNFKIARMKHSEIYQASTIQQRLRNLWLISREYLAILKFKIFKK
ncbi:MAG: YdcF family protein [Candidatus Aminicenantes bacterium]|nr:MAG: YdcF family protein [Candidatus Aminicenantes bacterium]